MSNLSDQILEDARNTILKFLNIRRDDFDERGQLQSTPDERHELSLAPMAPVYLMRFPEKNADWVWKYGRDNVPDDVAHDMNRRHLEDYLRKIRYDREECQRIYEQELELCVDGYAFGWARKACADRAANRRKICDRKGHHNRLPVWTLAEAGGQQEDDVKGQPYPEAKPKPKPERDADESSSFSWEDFWPSWLWPNGVEEDDSSPLPPSPPFVAPPPYVPVRRSSGAAAVPRWRPPRGGGKKN